MYLHRIDQQDAKCSPDELAYKYNLWLKLNGKWYTPAEFRNAFYGGHHRQYQGVELLSPFVALDQAWAQLRQAIDTRQPYAVISDYVRRINLFSDRLLLHVTEFKLPKVESVAWPVVPGPTFDKPPAPEPEKKNTVAFSPHRPRTADDE